MKGFDYFADMYVKRVGFLVVFLAALATLSGYLMSKASFIGRLGMTYMYKEYRFLKIWWQGALAIFLVWIILLTIQSFVNTSLSKTTATIIQLICLLLAVAGLYLTYADFQHTASHRWLKEKFHIGAYLFWLGWVVIAV